MAVDIKPGNWISIKVIKEPRAEASRKTLVRLFEKDRGIRKEQDRINSNREPKSHIRGGRVWYDRPSRVCIVKLAPGASCRIFGAVDVMRDLKSVARFVEVTPA